MKKLIATVIFCLAICVSAFAQSPLAELDKIKQIKLLESTREDVKRIFKDFPNFDSNQIDKGFVQTKYLNIYLSYSSGKCSDEREDGDEWNVPEGKIIELELNIMESISAQDLGIDFSKLRKEKTFNNSKITYVYYDKKAGVGYELWNGQIATITLRPSAKNYSLLCNNEKVKKFYSSKKWYRGKLKERWYISHPRPTANIVDLILSKEEITVDCETAVPENQQKCGNDVQIVVEAKGESPDPTDVLTYNYTVSGGKIIGTGANVTWDLSNVKPGTYTITAGVDNGCGVCGTTKTETVIVKECPDCKQKPK